jgi:hypothetical protein
MVALNDPIGYDEDRPEREKWTPAQGLRRGALFGLIAMVVIILLLAPVAVYAPYVLIAWLPRSAIAFVVAWILFSVVQRAAGMAGWMVTALAVTLTLVVLLSHHVVFRIHSVPTHTGAPSGWESLHPLTLVGLNLLPLILVGFCAALRHRGDGGLGAVSDVLNLFYFGSR